MRSLREGQVDRVGDRLIILHLKEKPAEIIPLIQENIDLIKNVPLTFDQPESFFQCESGDKMKGQPFGHDLLYRAWKRACARPGITGVYPPPISRHQTFDHLWA